MAIFRFNRTTHAQSTSADSITFDVPAGRYCRILQCEIKGMDSTAATGAAIGIYRVTTNGSGGTPTALTLINADPNGIAAPSGFTAKFGYTTPGTLDTAGPLWRGAFQPLGGVAKYIALPGTEISFWLVTAYQIALRGINGTPNISIDGEIEIL